jgi:hypothetical protein
LAAFLEYAALQEDAWLFEAAGGVEILGLIADTDSADALASILNAWIERGEGTALVKAIGSGALRVKGNKKLPVARKKQ